MPCLPVAEWTDRLIAALNGVVALSGGHLHTVALRADGSVVGVGDNLAGQLGSNVTFFWSETPVPAQGIASIAAVADRLVVESAGAGARLLHRIAGRHRRHRGLHVRRRRQPGVVPLRHRHARSAVRVGQLVDVRPGTDPHGTVPGAHADEQRLRAARDPVRHGHHRHPHASRRAHDAAAALQVPGIPAGGQDRPRRGRVGRKAISSRCRASCRASRTGRRTA